MTASTVGPGAAPYFAPQHMAAGTSEAARQEQGFVMLKVVNAIVFAAAVAAAFTFLSNNSGRVVAGPLAKPAQAALEACTQRPWPYLNCVGTPLGNPRIRLVTTDQLPS